ncbi:MAG: Grx4 family monothiol glutaredoxin [Burkholderiaceae bacterium]|nr:MAG: Grx4 family monothiol glutaredoxin [Burkholderiaceae bacterium]
MEQDIQQRIAAFVKSHDMVLFMKGNAGFPMCGFSARAIETLKASGVDLKALTTVDVLQDDDVRQGIKDYSHWPTIPQLYVKGQFVGGTDIMVEMYESGELQSLVDTKADSAAS